MLGDSEGAAGHPLEPTKDIGSAARCARMRRRRRYRDPISRASRSWRLDIASGCPRQPHQARFNDGNKPREIDFRVSCLPTLFGEKVVMRLRRGKLQLDMTKLGFAPDALVSSTQPSRSRGMVLVTAPLAAKTNTLYSAISQLNILA
jgi:type IV pilus assembly protein PilB